MATVTDIRVMVPRMRRALEGIGAAEVLSDEALKDGIADACADVILYTGSLFGKTLDVASTDPDTGAPDEYTTSDALTLAEQAVVAAQGALSYFFRRVSELKTSERISDEGSTWEYSLSASALTAWLKQLVAERDKALDVVAAGDAPQDQYASFIATRDHRTAVLVEGWGAESFGGGGLEQDWRFQ